MIEWTIGNIYLYAASVSSIAIIILYFYIKKHT